MFLKEMNKEGEGFDYLGKKISKHKRGQGKRSHFRLVLKESSFFQDLDFKNKLNAGDNRAWDAFEYVCSNLWGK